MLHWEAEAELQRRANRVSLRTLGRRPKAVGATAEGGAVFELAGARLVLRDDATHFNRLVPCRECAREVAGAPILQPEDLESPPAPLICPECAAARAGAPEEADAGSAPGPSIEARLDQLAAALDRRPSVEETQAAVEAAVAEASDRFRAGVASATASTAASVAAMEERVRQTLVGLAGVVDSQRAELAGALERRPTVEDSRAVADAAAAEAVAQVRAELAEALAHAQGEVVAKLRSELAEALAWAQGEAVAQFRAELAAAQAETAADVARRPTADATRAVVEAAVARAQAELAQAIAERPTEDAVRTVVDDAVSAAVAEARSEHGEALAALEAAMAVAVARRPTEEATRAAVEVALARARADLAAALEDRPTEEATRAMVDAAVASARAEQVEALAEARAELRATADAAAAGLQTVEEAVRQTVAGLAGLLDAQRTELDRLRAAQEELAGLDVRGDVERLAAMVGALRSDLEEAIDHAAQETASLTGARAELAAAQADLERRLAALAQAVEAGESGLHAVEQRILEELYRVNVRLERLQPPVRAARADEASLVETLDAQLQAAESRLAARAGQPGERG